MPTKIRLQRQGKKGQPFYHIIIADGRAPRDGRNIERIGTYNPVAKPAEVLLDFDRALYWVQTGAQPTDTVRSLLSYKGVMYKNHLLKGVAKGAMTEQQAELKYQEWMEAKQAKIENAGKELENKERASEKERIEAETKIKEARLEDIAKRRQAELDKEAEEKREAAKKAEEAKQEAEAKAEVREAKDAAPEAKTEEAPEAKAEEVSEAKTEKAPEAEAEKAAEDKKEA